jgi:hypothetical protein
MTRKATKAELQEELQRALASEQELISELSSANADYARLVVAHEALKSELEGLRAAVTTPKASPWPKRVKPVLRKRVLGWTSWEGTPSSRREVFHIIRTLSEGEDELTAYREAVEAAR